MTLPGPERPQSPTARARCSSEPVGRTAMSLLGHRPCAVAFDVNETLFDLSALHPCFEELGLPRHALDWWFAVLLRDGIALAAAGDHVTFPALATTALAEVAWAAGCPVPPDATTGLLEAFAELPAHRDVPVAFRRLRDVGIPIVALTNGAAPVTSGLLERAGLISLVSRVLSVDAVGHWKPRPEPYRYAASELGVVPERLAMVAVHPWDLHGAAAAGLVTGWANRTGRAYPSIFRRPHVEAPTLDGVVEGLLGLPAS